MQKLFIVGAFALGVLFLLGLYLSSEEGNTDGAISTEHDVYDLTEVFREHLVTRAVDKVGQPVEGFDALLLIEAFSKLELEDFVGVETGEGSYTVERGELILKREEGKPETSAAGTLSEAGYETLLQNLATRLSISLDDETDIITIIERIDTSARVHARIGERISALDVTLTPVAVLEESRCPRDVACVHAGTVRVRALLESGLGTADQIFTLHETITTEAERVTLTAVTPEPEATTTIPPEKYVLIFLIEKR